MGHPVYNPNNFGASDNSPEWVPPDPMGLFGFPHAPPFSRNSAATVALTGWQLLIQQGIQTFGSIFGAGRRVGLPGPATAPPTTTTPAVGVSTLLIGAGLLLAVLLVVRK